MEIIKQHFTEILTAIAGISAWFFEHKKRKQELQATNDVHQENIVRAYKDALTDLKERYDQKFAELDKEIHLLRKNLDLWKNKYRNLKSEFETYKGTHG